MWVFSNYLFPLASLFVILKQFPDTYYVLLALVAYFLLHF